MDLSKKTKQQKDELRKQQRLEQQKRDDALAEFAGRQGMAFTASHILSDMMMEEERDSWDDNSLGIDKDDYDSEGEYTAAVNAEKDLYWLDNNVGINKADYDDEDDYMDDVRDRWPDNNVDVYKEDYDTLEDYMEAVRDEGGTVRAVKRSRPVSKRQENLNEQFELLRIQRELQRKQQLEMEKKRQTFDSIFPEFRGIPIIWIIIGAFCFLFLLFTLIII